MEICETSALPIPMVPRLHQSNGYIKRKLRASRVQNCIALVWADTVLTSAWTKPMVISKGSYGHGESKIVLPKSVQTPYLPLGGRKVPRFMGVSKGPRMEICETSALPISMVPRLHQSNGYIKRKLRAWRVQNCITLVGADTVLTSAWKQSALFHGG